MRITFMFTESVGHSALFKILNRFGKWRPRKFIKIKTIAFDTQVFVLNSCKKKLIWVWHFADANRVKDFQWNCQNKHFHACMQYSILSKVICMYWRSFYGFPPLARFTIMPSRSNDKQFVSFDIILYKTIRRLVLKSFFFRFHALISYICKMRFAEFYLNL